MRLFVYVHRKAKRGDPVLWFRALYSGRIVETSESLARFLGAYETQAKEWCDRRFHRQWMGRDKYPWLRNPEQQLLEDYPYHECPPCSPRAFTCNLAVEPRLQSIARSNHA